MIESRSNVLTADLFIVGSLRGVYVSFFQTIAKRKLLFFHHKMYEFMFVSQRG